MNNSGSPMLTIDSLLAATRRRMNTDNTLDDEYVGTRVLFLHTGLTFSGTVKRCFLVIDRLRLGILRTIITTQKRYFL